MAEKPKSLDQPNNKPLLIGIILIVLGGAWILWEGVLRPETEAERTQRLADEKLARMKRR